MKQTRRILAIILALMMVASLAVTVFAAEEHSHVITIVNRNEGYSYNAYQIFDGDLGSDGVLSNIQWGAGVDGTALLNELKGNAAFATCKSAKEVAAILAGAPKAMDDPLAIAFAEVAAKHVKNDAAKEAKWNKTTKHYYIENLEDGYYIVLNTGVPSNAVNTTVSRYILEVVRDITVTHKGTYPSVEKKIVEAELKLDVNQAPVGADVKYEIIGTLPSTIDTYLTYYYAFHDTLSKGLTYNNDVKITVNGVNVTDYFYMEKSAYSETTGTSIYFAMQDILALELLEDADGNKVVGDINSDTKVIVTYSAKVNENAVISGTGNPNEVYLEYDNDPNTEQVPATPPTNPPKPTPAVPTGVTPKDEVRTYTTELTILKKDGSGAALTGAEFTLEGEAVKTVIITRETFVPAKTGETPVYWELLDGEFTDTAPTYDQKDEQGNVTVEGTRKYYKSDDATHVLGQKKEAVETTAAVKAKAFVGADGHVTFSGLGAGKYKLTETVTPEGFNTIDPIEFEIEFDSATCKFDVPKNNLIMTENDNTLYAEIVNVAGIVLPSTGGMGTTLFYIIGGILFAGAVVLLVTKKRMSV